MITGVRLLPEGTNPNKIRGNKKQTGTRPLRESWVCGLGKNELSKQIRWEVSAYLARILARVGTVGLNYWATKQEGGLAWGGSRAGSLGGQQDIRMPGVKSDGRDESGGGPLTHSLFKRAGRSFGSANRKGGGTGEIRTC